MGRQDWIDISSFLIAVLNMKKVYVVSFSLDFSSRAGNEPPISDATLCEFTYM